MKKTNHKINLNLDSKLFEALLETCSHQNISPSKFIRMAIKDKLKS